ncbi:leiomodin-2-like [Vigna unguiculata]|uniref:leiomodin-2-like n=1 Tax=Vigna unguiculata TaxID=3917 RepID=UPI001016CB35|nr:leiomodin-2-like [Vigna unguiculata]
MSPPSSPSPPPPSPSPSPPPPSPPPPSPPSPLPPPLFNMRQWAFDICRDSGKKIDALVAEIGIGGSITSARKFFEQKNPNIKKYTNNMVKELARRLMIQLATDTWGSDFPIGGVISKKILPPCVPTLLEVMRDPHVVVDGFTYEADAIQGWLNGSNDN